MEPSVDSRRSHLVRCRAPFCRVGCRRTGRLSSLHYERHASLHRSPPAHISCCYPRGRLRARLHMGDTYRPPEPNLRELAAGRAALAALAGTLLTPTTRHRAFEPADRLGWALSFAGDFPDGYGQLCCSAAIWMGLSGDQDGDATSLGRIIVAADCRWQAAFGVAQRDNQDGAGCARSVSAFAGDRRAMAERRR